MRTKVMILTGVFLLGFCAGCGQGESVAQVQEISETFGEAETDNADADAENVLSDEDGRHADDMEADSDDVKPSDADDGEHPDVEVKSEEPSLSAEEGQPEEKGADIPEKGRRLTAAELAEYTEWIQDHSNYGFLLSDWENPAQIDLYQVFYSNAGVGRPGTEEEKRAHLARWNQAEIETDFGAVDKANVDALLLEKVGFTYDELVANGSQGMEDWYYAETDSFCSESGDTNYCQFICTGGVINEEDAMVTLYFDGDDWVRTCEVKVSVESGHRTFLGNHIMEGMLINTEAYSERHTEGENK